MSKITANTEQLSAFNGLFSFYSRIQSEREVAAKIPNLTLDFCFPKLYDHKLHDSKLHDWTVKTGTWRNEITWRCKHDTYTHYLSWQHYPYYDSHIERAQSIAATLTRMCYDEDDKVTLTLLDDYSLVQLTTEDYHSLRVVYHLGVKSYGLSGNNIDPNQLLEYLPVLSDGFVLP